MSERGELIPFVDSSDSELIPINPRFGNVILDNEGMPGNSLKYEESTKKMSQRGSYVKIKNYERLSGGADVKRKSSTIVNKLSTDISAKVTPAASRTLIAVTDPEEEINTMPTGSRTHVEETTTGDKRVNEMIDYVIQNLQEAGKALASLGDNFEHDLKLLFVEVMGKVQNWVSLAQIRLDAAKTDLNSLHRELISRSNELASRDCEIANLRTQLIDSEVIRGAYEKTQTENVQRSGGTMPNPSTMNFVPSREPMPIGALPTQAGDIPLNPSDRSAIQSGIASSPTGGLFAQSGGISLDPSEHPVIQSGIAVNPTGALPTQPRGMPLDPSERSAIESGNASTLDPKLFQPPIRAGTMQSEGPMSEAMSARPGVTAPGTIDQQYSGDTKDELAYTKSQQAGGFTGSDHPSTVDAAVQSGKGRERSKRESQLESELSRLRKENEKITKERTDYENAIQRALLRGVSSLNAETLKVLRCSPVGCYTPCGPPPSPVNTLETMIPCVSKKTRDNWTPRGCRTTTNASSRVSSTRVRPNVAALPEQENNCCAAKRPSTANYGSFSRHKKSPVTSDPSMVFLLHQADASSVCISGNTSQIRPGGRTKSRKLETSVCVKKLG